MDADVSDEHNDKEMDSIDAGYMPENEEMEEASEDEENAHEEEEKKHG